MAYKKTDDWYIEWQRVIQQETTNNKEWQRMTTSKNKWQRVATNDNEWQQMAASGTTNENGTVHFKEWMAALKHKNRYATLRDG